MIDMIGKNFLILSISYLALSLLVLGVFADNINPAKAFDDFALFAHWFYACSDFHSRSELNAN
jgi:hypothetical protein